MAVCDNDCFNCKHEDCIRSFSQYDMYREAHIRYEKSEKGIINAKNHQRRKIESGKNAESCRRYYQKHREEILEKKRKARNAKKKKCKKAV